MIATQNWGPATPWTGVAGLDQFALDLQNRQLRGQALLLLSKDLDEALYENDPQRLKVALEQLRQLPMQDLLVLLCLLDPEVQAALAHALTGGQTACGRAGAPSGTRRTRQPYYGPRGGGQRAPAPGGGARGPDGGGRAGGPERSSKTIRDTNVPAANQYPPGSDRARALFREAAKLAGVPESWADSPGLHNILRRESNGQVGRPNYTYGSRARDPSQWASVHDELRRGVKSTRSSATGLGQLLLSNVDRYYPNGRAGIGDPLQEAAGMLAYIKDRYGSPERAWARYNTVHEGY